MNRRGFLKSVLGVLVVAVTAPTLLLPKSTEAALPCLPNDNLRKIQEKISAYLECYLFEINDKNIRESMSFVVNEFLAECRKDKIILNYRVYCDKYNNTPEVIDRNEGRMTVYLRMNRTPKFHLHDSKLQIFEWDQLEFTLGDASVRSKHVKKEFYGSPRWQS